MPRPGTSRLTVFSDLPSFWSPFFSSRQSPSSPKIGLSTDLYFPPILDLLDALSDSSPPEYLEIFRGRTTDLARARHSIPREIPLTYHGDCLWYTQADFPDNPAYREEVLRAKAHIQALDSPWMIHECAQKMMEGFSFGLYGPPLLTIDGALAARRGALALQHLLEDRLLLVETPPFPPHPPGPLDLGAFFHRLTDNTPIGIGLDIGHCLTYQAVSGQPVSPLSLVEWLLTTFPLDKVVEIHVGGLTSRPLERGNALIDDHSHRVPDLLFESLEAVLDHLPLPSLSGVALEVDNKSIPLIVEEFPRFFDIVSRSTKPAILLPGYGTTILSQCLEREEEVRLREGYATLAKDLTENYSSPYRRHFYPEEIWSFGGSMPDLFPDTLALLARQGLDVRHSFTDFFNAHPRSFVVPMDFLEVKVYRTLEWVEALATGGEEGLSRIRDTALREAHLILSAQEQFNGDPL